MNEGAEEVQFTYTPAQRALRDRATRLTERLYRDIRVDRIWEGTSEIQRMIIANEASKRGLSQLLQFGDGGSLAGDGTRPAGAALHA